MPIAVAVQIHSASVRSAVFRTQVMLFENSDVTVLVTTSSPGTSATVTGWCGYRAIAEIVAGAEHARPD